MSGDNVSQTFYLHVSSAQNSVSADKLVNERQIAEREVVTKVRHLRDSVNVNSTINAEREELEIFFVFISS